MDDKQIKLLRNTIRIHVTAASRSDFQAVLSPNVAEVAADTLDMAFDYEVHIEIKPVEALVK